MWDLNSGQQDFAYGVEKTVSRSSGPENSARVSIYADRPHVRASIVEDVQASGLYVQQASLLSELSPEGAGALSDVVLVDCPLVTAETLAALASLDMRAASSSTTLIVSTSIDGLEDVFACMDQSDPVLLVTPSRAERVLALGQVLARLPGGGVRELSDDDRLMLMRLTEQVGQIVGRIDRLGQNGLGAPHSSGGNQQQKSASSSPSLTISGQFEGELPNAKFIRRIIRQRQLRSKFFEGDLFADPAWDMLLDLTAARIEEQQVSITSLCIAALVPPTTALRWISQMVEVGLFVRINDPIDRRRAFIVLSDQTAEAMSRYFKEIALAGPTPI